MVGDPFPMHNYFHTIIGLTDAQDPLSSCVQHGGNHLPRPLHVFFYINKRSGETAELKRALVSTDFGYFRDTFLQTAHTLSTISL